MGRSVTGPQAETLELLNWQKMGYVLGMTDLLKDAIRAAEALPVKLQDEVARELRRVVERLARGEGNSPMTDQIEVVCDDAKARALTTVVMTDYDETLKVLAK